MPQEEKLTLTDEAIVTQNTIARLTKPTQDDFESLQEWIDRPSMGHITIDGENQNVWRDAPYADMIAINTHKFDDVLTLWVTRYLVWWFHTLVGQFIRTVSTQSCSGAISQYSRSTRKGFQPIPSTMDTPVS